MARLVQKKIISKIKIGKFAALLISSRNVSNVKIKLYEEWNSSQKMGHQIQWHFIEEKKIRCCCKKL